MTTDTSVGIIRALRLTFFVGPTLLMTPLMTTALGCLSRELHRHGSAIMNTLHQLGGAMSITVLVTAMSIGAAAAASTSAAPAIAEVSGTRWAFVLGGIFALIPMIASPFIKPLMRGDQRAIG